uniref:BRCA1-associated protein n=1 Tax=Kwoniella bestiolae CBS 10118 TaxID=1296100 RepID=A0A1B9FVH6_9TREE|nr:BRCA1-associated protein [Kwoniella bestiolae CBS 10118]OCF22770.1 BRCA1-associated protein [Kwoniella bestiolae CBS 10118]
MTLPIPSHLYSLIIAIHSSDSDQAQKQDWRLGDIDVDWVDFTQEKSIDKMPTTSTTHGSSSSSAPQIRRKPHPVTPTRTIPGSSLKPSPSSSKKPPSTDELSLQPLLAHYPTPPHSTGPNILDSSFASGISELGRGVVHLFKHPPPASLIASIDSHPVGEGSKTPQLQNDLVGEKAEGEDGSLIAILAVPAWMRPADFLEFIGGWGNALEGVRMIREATTPNRSIVLLKFRDPLQASDFSVIFTGKAFSTLDPRETCHPIRIHHLILHKLDKPSSALPGLLQGVGVDTLSTYELPSCPVCLERLDSTITGLVTLPCAHTFDCDCLRKWGDSKCPVCRLSHLLLSSNQNGSSSNGRGRDRNGDGREITRLTKCSMCDSTENNWICVVCGTVGCGRYEPSKGHARRHWEESGHVLAMELETQRVWDYKGDNYVHRLIQSRSDGKLVELPSASSLVTSISRPLPLGGTVTHQVSQNGTAHTPASSARTSLSSNDAGPSSGDVEKMSTIESITLEYSYLLSSQLESMRHHYESQQSTLLDRLEKLESSSKQNEGRLRELEDAEKQREKAESKALKAVELSRNLQRSLESEKSLTNGLSNKVTNLQSQLEGVKERLKEKESECVGLEETVRDLMFTLEAGIKVKELGDEGGQGGDIVVVPGKEKGKKKGKR